jgi:hypothetical protein
LERARSRTKTAKRPPSGKRTPYGPAPASRSPRTCSSERTQRLVAEAVFETGNAPAYLANFIAAAGQRQDGVMHRLGQSVAGGVSLPVPPFGGDDTLVGGVGVLVQPAGQRAAQVETDAPKMTRLRHRRVTLGGDALVPIGVGGGARLARETSGEGIRPRGLVKVGVDAEVAIGHR